MGKPRAALASVGLTSNGIVLVNVLNLLDAAAIAKLRSGLPKFPGADWFVGMAVSGAPLKGILLGLDDASAEAVARFGSQILGRGRRGGVP